MHSGVMKYVCMYGFEICVYVCTYVCVCKNICLYVCMYIYMYKLTKVSCLQGACLYICT